jgi:predicted dithiol-disulfide oxidoreductase (DUF899 family)
MRDDEQLSVVGADRFALPAAVDQNPGSIRHFYATEKKSSGPDEDDRHLDLLWVLWGALDLTPEGRDPRWRPSRPARR